MSFVSEGGSRTTDDTTYNPVCCKKRGAVIKCVTCLQQKHLKCERVPSFLTAVLESRYICKACTLVGTEAPDGEGMSSEIEENPDRESPTEGSSSQDSILQAIDGLTVMLTQKVGTSMSELQTNMSEMQEKVTSQVSELRTDMTSQVSELRTNVTAQVTRMNSRIEYSSAEMSRCIGELSQKIDSVATDLNLRFDTTVQALNRSVDEVKSDLTSVSSELNSKTEELDSKFEELRREFNTLRSERLRDDDRATFVKEVVGNDGRTDLVCEEHTTFIPVTTNIDLQAVVTTSVVTTSYAKSQYSWTNTTSTQIPIMTSRCFDSKMFEGEGVGNEFQFSCKRAFTNVLGENDFPFNSNTFTYQHPMSTPRLTDSRPHADLNKSSAWEFPKSDSRTVPADVQPKILEHQGPVNTLIEGKMPWHESYNMMEPNKSMDTKPLRLGDINLFPVFAGTQDESPREFIKLLTQNCDLTKLSSSDRMLVVARRLTGQAQVWFSHEQANMRSFNDFVRLFLNHFENPRLKKRYLQQLHSVRYNPSEYDNMVHFAWTLLNKYKQYSTDYNEDDAIELITQALPDSVGKLLRLHAPYSMNNLIEMLKTLDYPATTETSSTVIPTLELPGESKPKRSKPISNNEQRHKTNVRKVNLSKNSSTQTDNNNNRPGNNNGTNDTSNRRFNNFGNNPNSNFRDNFNPRNNDFNPNFRRRNGQNSNNNPNWRRRRYFDNRNVPNQTNRSNSGNSSFGNNTPPSNTVPIQNNVCAGHGQNTCNSNVPSGYHGVNNNLVNPSDTNRTQVTSRLVNCKCSVMPVETMVNKINGCKCNAMLGDCVSTRSNSGTQTNYVSPNVTEGIEFNSVSVQPCGTCGGDLNASGGLQQGREGPACLI